MGLRYCEGDSLHCSAHCPAPHRASGMRRTLLVAGIALAVISALATATGCSCSKTETKSGTVLANNVPVSAFDLARGDVVEVIGEENGYYQLKYSGESGSVTENGKGASVLLVEKWLVRLDTETAPQETKAFSKTGCQLFDNPYFSGNAIATPELDTELTVCDKFQRCAYVKLPDGKTGYVNTAFLGTEKEPEASSAEGSSDGADGNWYSSGSYSSYSDDSSYDGGGESSGGNSSGWSGGAIDAGVDTGSDGEDIVLSSLLSSIGVVEVAYAAESNTSTAAGKGVVLADNTKSYIAFLNRGDSVDMVIQSSDGTSGKNVVVNDEVRVLIDGQIGTIPASLVRDDETTPYTEWKGYATAGAQVYGDYALLGDIKTCEVNTEISVLDDIGSCYVVRVGELEGYMKKDQVSQTMVEEEIIEEELSGGYDGSSYYYNYSYGSGSSEGTSVDAGNTGSAQSVIEAATGGWTEEKL